MPFAYACFLACWINRGGSEIPAALAFIEAGTGLFAMQ